MDRWVPITLPHGNTPTPTHRHMFTSIRTTENYKYSLKWFSSTGINTSVYVYWSSEGKKWRLVEISTNKSKPKLVNIQEILHDGVTSTDGKIKHNPITQRQKKDKASKQCTTFPFLPVSYSIYSQNTWCLCLCHYLDNIVQFSVPQITNLKNLTFTVSLMGLSAVFWFGSSLLIFYFARLRHRGWFK